MTNLSNIPEPTSGYRLPDDEPQTHVLPLAVAVHTDSGEPTSPFEQQAEDQDQPDQQIDLASCLLLLLIAGGLLRAVLGFFGPLQGVSHFTSQHVNERAEQLFNGAPVNAYPLFDALSAGAALTGAAEWVVVAIGSLLTLASVPAAYVVGRALTGRRIAGLIAAALLAIHPAVLANANTLSPTALAMSLVTIGLALACHASKKGLPFAIGGGLCLGLAGLAAPLCWVVGLVAAPLIARQNLPKGPAKAIAYAVFVLVLAVTPALAFRAVFIGSDAPSLLTEFDRAASLASTETVPPIDRLLITMTDPSLAELGAALHLPLGNAGQLAAYQNTAPLADREPDVVADILADAWVLMNASLAGLAAVSAGVMIARRRYFETLLLTAPVMAITLSALPPGEVLRLPMIAMIGVLAVGLLSSRPVSHITDEQRAEKLAAKQAAKDEKQRAKQNRLLDKHKDTLYAFDKQDRRKKPRHKTNKAQPAEASIVTSVLSENVTDETPVHSRPI